MDFNRHTDILQSDDSILVKVPIDPADRHEQGGLILDSDDELSLDTDARVFSTSGSEALLVSPGSSNQSTRYNYESSSESTGYPRSHTIDRKLGHLGRLGSTESSFSDLSDISRTSHDVSSLLNAMTVDPEEFLADLGFGEADMRMRIPDRFLESPSKAQGIDVEFFRRSLDQDDVYGSPSQESPVWSDPGSGRIPLRFLTSHTEPINPVFSGVYSSVPLISEPEEVPEDSFDLMRHLRLNKPQHVTKGMFLEPVTEELEVSSVGSGTIRTKISRKLSNEEGTIIVREESLEQANVESELLLNVPVAGSEQTGSDVNETKEATVMVKVKVESKLVVDVAASQRTSVSPTGGAVLDNTVKSSSIVGHPCESSIDNKESISRDFTTSVDEEGVYLTPFSAVPTHLKVATIAVQDSFELEEIANEEYNEKELSSSPDEETSLIVTSPEKRLTRENSGESSGFEEMFPDKETASPNSSSPVLKTKTFLSVSPVVIGDRRPLEALLDPEMLSLAVEEKSPRATFGQRRTKSLTKQRPIDEDTFASWVLSPSSSATKYVADSLGTSEGHEDWTATSGCEVTGSNFLAESTQEPVIENMKPNLNSYVGETDENCNETSNFEPKNLPATVEPSELKESESSLGKQGATSVDKYENEMQTYEEPFSLQENTDTSIRQYDLSSHLESEIILKDEENIPHARPFQEEFILRQSVSENKELLSTRTDTTFPAQGDATSTHDVQGAHSELLARGKLFLTSLSEENGAVSACTEEMQMEESQKALRKVDFECRQHYLHEINVLEQSIQEYESNLCSEGLLDRVRTSSYNKHMLVRISEEMDAIQELRLLISSELERMKCLLSERRKMLLAGAARNPVCSGVTQKMADLLREQSSLNIGLSNISDELLIRKKASRRARIYAQIDSVKKELKEEREKCITEFREEIKETLARELSEKFSSEIDSLRHEVQCKDAVIEQLKKKREQKDLGD